MADDLELAAQLAGVVRLRGMADDLELAAQLVRDAGRLAAEMLRDGLTTRHKTSLSDVVSAADHAAEELIVSRLREERPDDGIVGEEGTDQPASSGRTWFVDPVDGTYNFLSGLPTWCAAIGLVDADGPVLGAVYQPVTDELWLGGRDHRTTCNGVALTPLADRELHELSVATYLHPDTLPDDGARGPLLRVMQGAATVRMLGSGSVELAAVAAGRLGVWAQIDSLDWDWMPGRALVEAAGGSTTVFSAGGHRWHVAGPPRAVAQVSELVRGATGAASRWAQLASVAATQLGASGSTPHVRVEGPLDELPGAIAEIAEAVVTEALANVVRHAYAGTVWVDATTDASQLVITVRDDGVGPNEDPIDAQPSGTGLRRMHDWATSLGGTCVLETNDPMGARLVWSVPLK